MNPKTRRQRRHARLAVKAASSVAVQLAIYCAASLLAAQERPLTPEAPVGSERADAEWERESALYAAEAEEALRKVKDPRQALSLLRKSSLLRESARRELLSRGLPIVVVQGFGEKWKEMGHVVL